MGKYGKLIDSTTLQFERTLPGPIERVWEYLVDGEKRALWFAGGLTDLSPNGNMEFHFNNSKFSSVPDPTPEKYSEYADGSKSLATIVQYEEPYLLVFNWEEGLITFKLEELNNDQIKFTLTHERLQDSKEYRVGTLAGWHTHLDILHDHLNNLEIKSFWTVHMKLESEYEDRLT